MCGFLVLIGDRWRRDFSTALDSLAHRGPDGRGEWHDGPVHLGHRRLSIIDLSDAAAQPMASAGGRYEIVYNGELYNFPELRDELLGAGATFRGHSDTEVLLEAFARWGPEKLLERADGMFAFAVWDRERGELFAARDRIGIKPLYYSTADGLAMASTLEPFWKLEGFPRRIDYEALRDLLAAQSIFAPRSILRDVRALGPGSWLRWRLETRRVETSRYWDIPGPTSSPMGFDELVEATDAALAESVKRQLVSDVPLGAFLSGGVDSSLVVHYTASATGRPPPTFNVRFPGEADHDEGRFARLVAERYGTEHVELDGREVTADALLDALASLDQPLADPAFLPTLGLSEMTRRHVTVAISGDGGDELFGGYPRFLRDESYWRDNGWYAALRALHRARLLPGSLLRRSLRGADRVLWHRVQFGPYAASRKSMAGLVTPDAYAEMRPDRTLEVWRDLSRRYGGRMDTDSLMRADLWTYLQDNCLVKTDRASMRHSLEVRVPFLGNPVVDLVLPQPASVKLRDGLKSVLVELARRHLPREVWDREKHGFSVPLRRSFAGPWREACRELVACAPELAPFLDARALEERWRRVASGRGTSAAMYTFIALLAWLRAHPLGS